MAINEKAKAQIFLDGKQAESALDGLRRRAADLREQMKAAQEAGDNVKLKRLTSEIKGVEAAQRSLKKESFDVEKVLNNLDGSSYNDISKALAKANRELRNMKSNDPGWQEQRNKVTQLKDAQSALTNEMRLSGKFATNMKNSFKSMPGPLGGAIRSVMGLSKALWAIVTNPIGAVVAALVGAVMLLFNAFKSTDSGATMLAGVMKAMSTVMDLVLARVMTLANAIGRLLKGDFKGFRKGATDAFSGVGAAIKEAATEAYRYEQVMDSIKDREAASLIRSKKLRAEIEELKNATRDQTKTNKERLAAAELATAKEIELYEIENQFMKERNKAELDLLASKIQNSKLTREERQKQLEEWLQIDDRELESMRKKDKAFADFYNNNEEAFQNLQKLKADEFQAEAAFSQRTRMLQREMSGMKKKLNEEAAKAEAERIKAELEAVAKQHERELFELKKAMADQGATKEEINKAIEAKELEHIEALIAHQQKYGHDTLALESKLIEARIKQNDEAAKAEAERIKAEKEARFNEIEAQEKAEEMEIKRQLANNEITAREAQEVRLQNEMDFLHQRLALKKEFSEDTAEIENQIVEKAFDITQAALETEKQELQELNELRRQFADEKILKETELAEELAELDRVTKEGQLVSEEEYQRMKSAIVSKYEESRFETVKKYLQAAGDILGSLGNMYQAQKEAELAQAQGNAEEEDKIRRKYANKEKRVASGQALISGALSVMRIWEGKISGNPVIDAIIKGIMTAAMVVTTREQVKAINAQQFYAGGYTPQGGKYEPAGIVHKGEFVGSQEAVKNPSVKRVFDIIDIAQRNGTISQLKLPKAVVSTYSAPIPNRGFSSGGYGNPDDSLPLSGIGGNSSQHPTLEQTAEMIVKGVQASVDYTNIFGEKLTNTLTEVSKAANKLADKPMEINAREVIKKNNDYEAAVKASEY